jgi:hypothetical protein
VRRTSVGTVMTIQSYIKSRELFPHLRDYQLLKNDSAPRIWLVGRIGESVHQTGIFLALAGMSPTLQSVTLVYSTGH